jgi:hypothetical protein
VCWVAGEVLAVVMRRKRNRRLTIHIAGARALDHEGRGTGTEAVPTG